MSVSDRTRGKPTAFSQMLRTFFQKYDDQEEGVSRIAALRALPFGSAAAFFFEQILWRVQRSAFGITLMEVDRLLELATQEAAALNRDLDGLQNEVSELRALLAARA
jgi:hypothetical protein